MKSSLQCIAGIPWHRNGAIGMQGFFDSAQNDRSKKEHRLMSDDRMVVAGDENSFLQTADLLYFLRI
jgi:hypothetical protein